MEHVREFSEQLASLYESKPPVSKKRMNEITKTAMKGLKLYKHVVMAVEKFIQKCSDEYKIPGLYVIDSIIRMSKHQFKTKDVFGPRFEKNFMQTFDTVFSVPNEDDKKRALKVVKLWRESAVMNIELLDACIAKANGEGIDIDVPKFKPLKEAPKTPPPENGHEKSPQKSTEISTKFAEQLNSFAQHLGSANVPGGTPPVSSAYRQQRSYDNIDPVTGAPLPAAQTSHDTTVSNLLRKIDYSDDEDDVPRRHDTDIRSKRHRRYRSRSHSGDRKRRRSRSRSRDRRSKRSPEKEQRRVEEEKKKQRERAEETPEEKERHRLMLPPPRPSHITVASRIIWLGRLPTLTDEREISNEVKLQLMKEGPGEPIVEYIQSKACAFITMPDRRAAVRAFDRANSHSTPFTMHNKRPRISWAPSKKIKEQGEWDEEKGVTFLHWGVLAHKNLQELVDGGHLVVSSLPAEMQEKYTELGTLKLPPEIPPLPMTQPPPGAFAGMPTQQFQQQMRMPPPPFMRPPNMQQLPPGLPPGVPPSTQGAQAPQFPPRMPPMMPPGSMPHLPPFPPVAAGMGGPFTHPPPNVSMPPPNSVMPPADHRPDQSIYTRAPNFTLPPRHFFGNNVPPSTSAPNMTVAPHTIATGPPRGVQTSTRFDTPPPRFRPPMGHFNEPPTSGEGAPRFDKPPLLQGGGDQAETGQRHSRFDQQHATHTVQSVRLGGGFQQSQPTEQEDDIERDAISQYETSESSRLAGAPLMQAPPSTAPTQIPSGVMSAPHFGAPSSLMMAPRMSQTQTPMPVPDDDLQPPGL